MPSSRTILGGSFILSRRTAVAPTELNLRRVRLSGKKNIQSVGAVASEAPIGELGGSMEISTGIVLSLIVAGYSSQGSYRGAPTNTLI